MNLRPIIGILDQPSPSDSDCNLVSYGKNYIPASYVKLVESSGARVVPIHYDSSKSELESLFNSINGFVLPGGGSNFTPGTQFYDSAKYLFDLAITANSQGDYFPVIGICQGMEMLSVMMAGSTCKILDYDYDAENLSLPLIFNSNSTDSMLWGTAPSHVISSISTQNITFNNHNNGLPPSKYYGNSEIQSYVKIISTNYDRNGKEFVSSYEGIDYPIWGLQFHPSKLAYEWDEDEVLNHSPVAIADMQWVASLMYSQAKYNFHSFPSSEDEQNALIYNYNPVFTYSECMDFVQCYFWN